MGVRMQDLWMMISGSPAEQQRQWADFLDGARQIFNGIRAAAHLHEADCEFLCHKI
jgi:hypothetical protein